MNDWEAIVLDLDGGKRLERCLTSLEIQSRPPDRIVVLDNGSRSPVSERIGERSVEIDLVRSERNLGFTGGVNLAWRRTSARWIALINNDVELREGWAATLIDEIERGEGIGAAQPIILTPEGRIDGAGIDVSTGRFLQVAHGDPVGSHLAEPWGVSATATLFRRQALEEVAIDGDLFHPMFFAYYEDVELSARLRAAGWKLVLVREPLATHEGSTTAPSLGTKAEYLRTRNRYWITRLHRDLGRTSAFLREDAGKLLRASLQMHPRKALAIARGVIAGLVKLKIEN